MVLYVFLKLQMRESPASAGSDCVSSAQSASGLPCTLDVSMYLCSVLSAVSEMGQC